MTEIELKLHRWQHVKTQGIYVVLEESLREDDHVPLLTYQNVETRQKWTRLKSEFLDGRFRIAPNTFAEVFGSLAELPDEDFEGMNESLSPESKPTLSGFFIPISSETPQSRVSERLAELLCQDRITGIGALPIAIRILAGVQKAIDARDPEAAIIEWDESKRRSEEFWLRHHPKSSKAKRIRKQRAFELGLAEHKGSSLKEEPL